MSIILRHPITRERILFCKGADSAVFPRLKKHDPTSEEEAILEKTNRHINMYAKQGLRVLVMAKRILSDEEYDEWLELHRAAEVCLFFDTYTVFPHIVSAETIYFLNLEIVANSNSCRNISIFYFIN